MYCHDCRRLRFLALILTDDDVALRVQCLEEAGVNGVSALDP
jgi:hypothetical protein